MPAFRPFKGLRYAVDGPLDDLVAPPYDVVTPQERDALARRHPANAIHVELPEPLVDQGLDRYAAAAEHLRAWQADGTLRPDPAEALYRYRMTTGDGQVTTGIVGLLRCEPEGGDILPHEETIPKDTTDRLQLLRACNTNLSPIWGLSLAAGLAVQCRDLRPPDASASAGGVTHDLWVVDDPAAVAEICRTVGSAPVVIADGHHRYHTALTYAGETRHQTAGDPKTGSGTGDAAGPAGTVDGSIEADWVMALIVELAPGELHVGAIHRTVHTMDDPAGMQAAIAEHFDMIPVANPDDDNTLTLVTADGCWALHPNPATVAAVGTDLDSATVRALTASMPGAVVDFEPDRARAIATVAAGNADAAFLLQPVSVETIGAWAAGRRRMPPKSTYFMPKPRTGMVYRTFEPAGVAR